MTRHERTLRQDVRELGALLGRVIEEQTSTAVFELVESIRTDAIAYRRGEMDSRDDLRDRIRALDPAEARAVARAFTTFFELINLAEERERVRAIRDASQDGTLEHTLDGAVEALPDDPFAAREVLESVSIEPTFTAHPTEARRKTVNATLRRIADCLRTHDEESLTDAERTQVWRRLEAEVTVLWQTPQLRRRRPQPEDEARNVQWYLEHSLFEVVGEVYEEFEDALERGGYDVDVPSLFSFRSWAGSDSDGNPFVTPSVTAWTLSRQRAVALEAYRRSLESLATVLGQRRGRIGVDDRFEDDLERDLERFPDLAASLRERNPDEPYRQKLGVMVERIRRVRDDRGGYYDGSATFESDLSAIAESLRANGGESVARVHVDPLRRRVETFGFGLARHDLRDHRENHTTAVEAVFERAGIDYASATESERCRILTEAILGTDDLDEERSTTGDGFDPDEAVAEVLERFEALAAWQDEFGVETIDAYCISMAATPSHVLEVLFLADRAGVTKLPARSGLDVVPLFETEAALSSAEAILTTLLENEAFRAGVAAREDVLEVMIGYSDSNKENGFFAANWSLHRSQRRLAAVAAEYGVTLRLFHGRGGSISRGGGPMNEALLALPPETASGPVKFTVQGEAIAESYANRRIAERELEQMLNAQCRRVSAAREGETESPPSEWTEVMETAAGAARDAYRDLLETDGFVPYFEAATPIGVIDELHLGSRPSARTDERTVESLRAIPWVFAWTQSRCILPGWYGLGTGLETVLQDEGNVETLQQMYAEWPFFRTTIDNGARALALTDLEIAATYAELSPPELRERFFPRIEDEYRLSVEHVQGIVDRESLFDREWLAESVGRRNPYVDPLNLLQVALLEQEERPEELEATLHLTVKGIAAGMKNTG